MCIVCIIILIIIIISWKEDNSRKLHIQFERIVEFSSFEFSAFIEFSNRIYDSFEFLANKHSVVIVIELNSIGRWLCYFSHLFIVLFHDSSNNERAKFQHEFRNSFSLQIRPNEFWIFRWHRMQLQISRKWT